MKWALESRIRKNIYFMNRYNFSNEIVLLLLCQVVADAPWTITDEYIKKHKIDFVAHDDMPYGADDTEDIYAPLKAKGMFVATERTEGI